MAIMSFISAAKLVELVKSANKGGEMYVRVVSGNRLALGNDPMNPTVSIDLSKEAFGPYKKESKAQAVEESQSQANSVRATRRSGEYWIELHGKRFEFGSLRELLGQSLRSIEAERPGTLEKLSQIKPKSKRIVARDKKLLFDSEHLSDEYGEDLMTGWWYGINNSSQETSTWLKRACGCAGLKWGKDFRTNLSD
jgi:hypothetical protein